MLISPELLKDEGLLTDADLSNVPHFSDEEVDFAAVGEYKKELFKKAFARFKELPEDNPLKSVRAHTGLMIMQCLWQSRSPKAALTG